MIIPQNYVVYIEENYRNKGICSLLINELILYTLKGNEPAISLYTKLGFAEIDIEEKEENIEYMSYLDDSILEEIDKYTIYMEKNL